MAESGIGTVFKRATVAIAGITGIVGPSMTRDTIDTTTLDVSDGYRTFIAALRDAGTLVLSMNFLTAGYTTMKTDFESDTPIAYTIVLPGGEELAFNALVTEMPLNVPVDDKITMDVTLKISGTVTYTP